jgi:prophage DNA circulation protein
LVLQEVGSTALNIAKSNPLSPTTANKFTTLNPISVMELAMQFYGRSDRAASLLAINNFSDALRIPAGSVINVLPM